MIPEQDHYRRIFSRIEAAVDSMDSMDIASFGGGIKKTFYGEIQMQLCNVARDLSRLVGVLSPEEMEKLKLKYSLAREYTHDKLQVIMRISDLTALLKELHRQEDRDKEIK